jgi:prolipoprotein diacylglyceryl transferase
VILSIPSPSVSGFSIGPLQIHFYALCLIAGIIAAWIIGLRRWRARGGTQEDFETIVLWAIPIGIVGARFYHVMTHLGDYFAPGINPWSVLFIWEGGIAIYGAIGFGALGAAVACRRRGVKFGAFGDALAPGLAVAQALGRWGNWFNQELYGGPTDLPWGLEIDLAHRAPGFEQYATFHPTFLYEMLWNLLVAAVLVLVDRRFRLGRGKLLALYVALYTFGRFFTEGIRLDYSYDVFGPIRFNQAMAGLFFIVALGVFLWMLKYRPGADEDVYLPSGAGTGGRFAQSSEEPNEAGEQSEEPGSEESSEEPEADLPDADLPDPEGGA